MASPQPRSPATRAASPPPPTASLSTSDALDLVMCLMNGVAPTVANANLIRYHNDSTANSKSSASSVTPLLPLRDRNEVLRECIALSTGLSFDSAQDETAFYFRLPQELAQQQLPEMGKDVAKTAEQSATVAASPEEAEDIETQFASTPLTYAMDNNNIANQRESYFSNAKNNQQQQQQKMLQKMAEARDCDVPTLMVGKLCDTLYNVSRRNPSSKSAVGDNVVYSAEVIPEELLVT